jgi:autoinducer 2 (AI-2) kinase
MQTLADILGSTIHTPRVNEAGALGAAILAAVGVAMYPSLPEAIKTMVQTGPLYMPEESQHSHYDTLYIAWRQVEAQWNLKGKKC